MFLFQVLLILIWGYVFQADTVFSIEDWKLISNPSHFLEPPPISRSFRSHYFGSKHQTPTAAPKIAQRSVQSKWYDPRKQWPPLLDSVPKFSDYTYHELQCNPCNNVPWIPIITFNPPKIISTAQNHHPAPLQSPFNSYYHTFNEMTANLIKPINVLAPTLPLYVGAPVYQQHVQNPAWHSGPAVNPTVHTGNHITPVFSLPQETNRNVDANVVASSPWLQGAKPIPVFHYSHTIEYPAQFSTVPSTDLSVQPTSLPFSHVTHLPVRVHYAEDNSDGLHDILSNHLDDTKYSSSEDKFSVTSNETVKDVRQLKSNETEASPVYNNTQLTEYLTPPVSADNNEWRFSGHKEHVEIKPLENWAFVNAVNSKPEKKKKQIQIVIPYTVTKNKHNPKVLGENITSWNSAIKIREVRTSTSTSTTVLPIIRHLRDNVTTKKQEWTDWQKLRKAIDTWTVERFSNHKYTNLTSLVDVTSPPTTWKTLKDDLLQESVYQVDNHINKGKPDEIQNRVSSGKKNDAESVSKSKPWKDLPTTVSSITKEKVFIVTPVPLTSYNLSSNDITNDNWRTL